MLALEPGETFGLKLFLAKNVELATLKYFANSCHFQHIVLVGKKKQQNKSECFGGVIQNNFQFFWNLNI